MARPTKFDRGKAVELVMNEFWRSGYEANSVKALSEKLGITRSSFYNAFGSREYLFKEALALYASTTPDRPLAVATPGGSVKRLLTETLRAICKDRANDPDMRGCMAVNSVAELCNSHEELGEVSANAIMGSVERISEILGWGKAQGEIAPDADTQTLALAVQNLVIGLNLMCKIIPDEEELWKVAKITLEGLELFDEA